MEIHDEDLDPICCVRFLHAALLAACVDAHAGDVVAMAWLVGAESKLWADLAGLDAWPPRREQLSTRRELIRRAKDISAEIPWLVPWRPGQ
jgi:hypothetical protein